MHECVYVVSTFSLLVLSDFGKGFTSIMTLIMVVKVLKINKEMMFNEAGANSNWFDYTLDNCKANTETKNHLHTHSHLWTILMSLGCGIKPECPGGNLHMSCNLTHKGVHGKSGDVVQLVFTLCFNILIHWIYYVSGQKEI